MKRIKKRIKKVKEKVIKKYHQWKPYIIRLDVLLIGLSLALLGIARPDLVVISAFFLIIPYLLMTKRALLFYNMIIAFAVALAWMLIANSKYSYNQQFITVAGINLFPLFAWASGIWACYLLYAHYEHRIKHPTFFKRIALYTAFYWPTLILADTLGYHAFNIKNLAAASYSGLPLCNCIHAAPWMQASYFIIGLVFFTTCFLLGLECPHRHSGKSQNQQ
jgi:hypothetical protein